VISQDSTLLLTVTPFVGVLIEMTPLVQTTIAKKVTPFVGVLIEISVSFGNQLKAMVTPFVGVLIEIFFFLISFSRVSGHSLRGSVD